MTAWSMVHLAIRAGWVDEVTAVELGGLSDRLVVGESFLDVLEPGWEVQCNATTVPHYTRNRNHEDI